MKTLLGFLKTTLIGGLLVVAPFWICLLLVLRGLTEAASVVRPISASLPEEVSHPHLLAVLLLLAACFGAGLFVRTAVGRYAREVVERRLLERVPGYTTLRDVSENLAGINRDRGFLVALAELENALVPAFVVERHADGQCTVFVPSAPTPLTGSIYIMPAGRVHLVDVPLATALRCISRYGAGSSELLADLPPAGPHTPSAQQVP